VLRNARSVVGNIVPGRPDRRHRARRRGRAPSVDAHELGESDRRALAKLTGLRRCLRRYRSLGKILDKLNSPNLEKALTFLDDQLLPATSNAVERGNRRYRKMQKAVYHVRKQETLQGLQREGQASERQDTLATLNQTRR
jgi:hypothetical protein